MHLTAVLTTALAAAGHAAAARQCTKLPQLELPYGTWKAAKYDFDADVYAFRNIRYAASPVGDLRFAPPAPPEPVAEIQDGSYGPLCLQFTDEGAVKEGSGEDCLFLDVYVPGSALKSQTKKLSVMLYIYGGSYTGGGKDNRYDVGLYDGTGWVHESTGDAIVVVPNYRLGSLGGWWGGKTTIAANATSLGLADQRAALQWVQDHIHLLGGNPDDVTIMGQSAGGGSIMHQITQKGGKRDPLFHKAIVQSPGWQDVWDAKRSEDVFQTFAANAGCAGGDFACLRAVSAEDIMKAQAKWSGVAFGPTPDGDWIQDHAAFELKNGNYWKDLKSVVATHVVNEGGLFVGAPYLSDSDVTNVLLGLYQDAAVVAEIEKFYPPVNSTGSPYKTGVERQGAILSDAIFLANYRHLVEAFADRVWVSSRTRANAGHGQDVPLTWYNPTLDLGGVPLPEVIGDGAASQAWQSYLIGYIVDGDVNARRNVSETVEWPRVPSVGRERLTALNIAEDGFKIIQDGQGTKSVADFWAGILKTVSEGQDYS
jgi:carboxylesterase type B